MKFPGFLTPRRDRRARPLAALLTSVALATGLAGCGGGTSQIDAFVAERLIAFGDEHSALTPDGRKYIANALDEGVLDCAANPIWVQALASLYDFVFAECNPDDVATPQAVMRAAAGARLADMEAQIDAQLAGDGVGGETLATVLVGTNDLLDLYATYPGVARSELLTQARQRGAAVAVQVNRLVDAGARVIVSTVPDLGLTPFALAENADADDDRDGLLSALSTEFNAGLRTTILNDGRFVGLVLADEMVQAMAKSPGSFGLANIDDAACAVALPDCTSATLVSGADATTWLWADDLRIGFNAQNRLGILAVNRARGNPF